MNKNNDVNSMNLAENNLDYTNMQICALSDLHLHLKQSIVGTAHKCRYYTNTDTNTNTVTNTIQLYKYVHYLIYISICNINCGNITQIQAKSLRNDE